MTDKKKKTSETKETTEKKSIAYVRPGLGTFTLLAHPNFEFKFRKITLDDDAWVMEHFKEPIWKIVTKEKREAETLCRLYFHFLEDEAKALFPPERKKEIDYYNGGETKEVLINGPKKFMRAIDGGSLTEMLIINEAFLHTLLASRPISDLPEHLKKKVEEAIKRAKAQKAKQVLTIPPEEKAPTEAPANP